MRTLLRGLLRRLGLDLVRHRPAPPHPPDFDPEAAAIAAAVAPYTLTSPERVFAVCTAARYLVDAGVPGAFVECGVWRGGSSMAAALALLGRGVADRELYLFDTFEGMPPPGARDVSHTGESAAARMGRSSRADPRSVWAAAGLDDVRANLAGTGYPRERLHFVPGRVEATLPAAAPEQIALLRLDTDWYESTRHELLHLFPRIAPGGVLIVDDYGHWRGAREAVDEYLRERGLHLLLHRVDYTCRVAVIPPL